eukprot:jgi/Mesen1/9301/ME000060S08738
MQPSGVIGGAFGVARGKAAGRSEGGGKPKQQKQQQQQEGADRKRGGRKGGTSQKEQGAARQETGGGEEALAPGEDLARQRRLQRFGTQEDPPSDQASNPPLPTPPPANAFRGAETRAQQQQQQWHGLPGGAPPTFIGGRGAGGWPGGSASAASQLSPAPGGMPGGGMADDGGGGEDTDWRTAEAIQGVCPDMCPAHERGVRERNGALDPFERVGGDRTRTSADLAVKKYTRTPERDPALIRPLPVLERTMGYLLSLLDVPHGADELLAIHSFLWDRMRAVRMDLRMQHLFTDAAIRMHEQMIRFHIVAMHELCEIPKGEGFQEGFDAHLNIEQMNKACVDLFEMYDDHRRAGRPAGGELETRGFYALLKVDKHPGFKVEPAELARELLRMPPEVRSSPQVRFAREVARACRAGRDLAFTETPHCTHV